MEGDDVFEAFDTGKYAAPEAERDFSQLVWNAHPKFPGVALKHLLIGKDTGGTFSYHLVRIDPGKAIGDHLHDPQLETHEVIAGSGECVNGGTRITYQPGVVSVFQPRVRHEVTAGESGLKLFAKFMPPLC